MKLDIPIEPDADEARRWLEDELAKPVYSGEGKSWFERALEWIQDFLKSLPTIGRGDGGLLNPGVIVAIVLGIAVIGLLIWVLVGRKNLRRRAEQSAAMFEDDPRTAAEIAASAREAALAGDWHTAVLEQFRAMVRKIEERGVVDVVPGMTAHEFTLAAGLVMPDHALDLARAGDVFDEVRYGHSPATRERYDEMLQVHDVVVVAPAHRTVTS